MITYICLEVYMKSLISLSAVFLFLSVDATAQITISVDASSEKTPVSPYLYGRNLYAGYNGDLLDGSDTLTATELANIETYKQAGVRYLRMNQGNNGTKHNWRKNLSSHPDYFNNVYYHNWDYSAKKILDKLPGVDALYGFQLTGYAASNTENNFDEQAHKKQYGSVPSNHNLNLAGGGVADASGNLVTAGDPMKYLEEWPVDSSVKILEHWRDDLKFDMKRLQYWSMDNEMEIWRGTHDDLPYEFPDNSTVAPERMVNNYVAAAKAAKAIMPDVKLTGPVAANEWSWCNIRYDDKDGKGVTSYVKAPDRNYCWMEYFIKRLAEEQKKTDVKLLDVFDIHWYPTEKDYESWINWHRVFFDTTYVYPGANGIKRANPTCKWDETITREYIFKRIDDWMKEYFGEDYEYTFGFTETDFIADMDAMTRALVYASFMGTFMDHGVEIFTPWTWREGMYEVLHLFSNYAKGYRVVSVSSNDSLVSAYSSVTETGDSMTVIFVNRSQTASQQVTLNVAGMNVPDGNAKTLSLSGLTGETFVSHTNNALKAGSATVASNKLTLSLPAKSIVAVLLKDPSKPAAIRPAVLGTPWKARAENGFIYVGNLGANQSIRSVALFNSMGQRILLRRGLTGGEIRLNNTPLQPGVYLVRLETATGLQLQTVKVTR